MKSTDLPVSPPYLPMIDRSGNKSFKKNCYS